MVDNKYNNKIKKNNDMDCIECTNLFYSIISFDTF